MTGTISIEVRPHWVSGWFLRWAAKPFVRVDGEERPVTWRRPWSVALVAQNGSTNGSRFTVRQARRP